MTDDHDGRHDGAVRRALADGTDDLFVREEPLLLRIHGRQLLTMRTPGRDADLAVGFLLGEGVVSAADEVVEVREVAADAERRVPDAVDVVLRNPSRTLQSGRLDRTHEIRSSCGLCGLADADEFLEDLPPLLPGIPRLDRNAIDARRVRFEQEQPLFSATGACHAAVVFGPDGEVWSRGEDVGRHNALDKAIGRAALDGRALTHATAMLSGRAGFDLVLKCLRVRIPVILSVSAPSALSFDACRAAGATLVGFVRPGRMKIYLDGGRVTG